MTLPFFHKSGVKKKKETKNTTESSYPTLSSLIQKTSPIEEQQQQNNIQQETELLQAEELDENFFYKHVMTHFHSLFCESAIVCIPHSRSIEGLVLTKDIIGKKPKKQDFLLCIIKTLIIETHCFQTSPYFCGQYRATKQKQKIIELDDPIISTIEGFKEVRTVHIMDEEVSYKRNNKIRILLIDRLLEGEPPVSFVHLVYN